MHPRGGGLVVTDRPPGPGDDSGGSFVPAAILLAILLVVAGRKSSEKPKLPETDAASTKTEPCKNVSWRRIVSLAIVSTTVSVLAHSAFHEESTQMGVAVLGSFRNRMRPLAIQGRFLFIDISAYKAVDGETPAEVFEKLYASLQEDRGNGLDPPLAIGFDGDLSVFDGSTISLNRDRALKALSLIQRDFCPVVAGADRQAVQRPELRWGVPNVHLIPGAMRAGWTGLDYPMQFETPFGALDSLALALVRASGWHYVLGGFSRPKVTAEQVTLGPNTRIASSRYLPAATLERVRREVGRIVVKPGGNSGLLDEADRGRLPGKMVLIAFLKETPSGRHDYVPAHGREMAERDPNEGWRGAYGQATAVEIAVNPIYRLPDSAALWIDLVLGWSCLAAGQFLEYRCPRRIKARVFLHSAILMAMLILAAILSLFGIILDVVFGLSASICLDVVSVVTLERYHEAKENIPLEIFSHES